jgi:hypothetical protein
MAKTATTLERRPSDTQDRYRNDDLRQSPTMVRLIEALKKKTDIGANGLFIFVTTARHFMNEDEIVALVNQQPDMDEEKARAFVLHIKERGYNPPRRERILEMQGQQKFAIIANPEDPDSGNLYRELRFPEEVYEDIQEYYEEKVAAQS